MKIIKITCFVAVLLSISVANSAEVRSISREVKSNLEDQIVWTVYVKCADVDEERSLERLDGSRQWCAEDLPTMCSRNKVKVASKVCGTHFERLVFKHRMKQSEEAASTDK